MADKAETPTEGMPLRPHSQEEMQQQEDELKNNESGEEYSSGSDRSFEGDNAETVTEGTSESSVLTAKIRSKKRRHGSHGSRRQKGGSRHPHKHRNDRSYQPYPDKGDIETSLKRKSLELQEKENAAALLRQEGGEDQFVTFPVAPFNSTQFLMDEHSLNSPINGVSKTDINSPKFCTQDVALSSMPSTPRPDNDDTDALINFNKKDKEFSDIYSSIHAENLQSMPKEQLVKHYMSLEEQVASLQRKVAAAEQRSVISECVKRKGNNLMSDKDNVSGSDTNSLSSGNEEFVDLSSMNQPAIDDKGSGPSDVVKI